MSSRGTWVFEPPDAEAPAGVRAEQEDRLQAQEAHAYKAAADLSETDARRILIALLVAAGVVAGTLVGVAGEPLVGVAVAVLVMVGLLVVTFFIRSVVYATELLYDILMNLSGR